MTFHTNAITGSAIVNGNWNANTTWLFNGSNRLPTCGDTLSIPAGITVTVNSQENLAWCSSPIIIYVAGVLQFTNGNKLDLPCGSVVYIQSGGLIKKATAGGGNSTLISICNFTWWNAGDGPLSGPDTLGYPSPLPVTWLDASAVRLGETVLVQWTTATEINNNCFTILRSTDAILWHTAGTMPGSGNSSINIHYAFTDDNPYPCDCYYRIRQTDFDGKSAYSDIIHLKGKNTHGIIGPVSLVHKDNAALLLSFSASQSASATVRLCSASSAITASSEINFTRGHNTISLTLPHPLPSAIHFITLYVDNQLQQTIKFIPFK